ncbi:DUF1090 domain-containing protein [Halomonas sp. 7T]|uniref:DUF1090 domain-containing protein n=1 Tax=Halomonas sp. 7T TaxID=2893469 RepID=UPI0021DA21F4|nr:DUF1090 domain-containing protein [Halomonas sp. 7T]UXZ54500.1 DUF1090 domain-containing protein [Halomonas sp. 7T]
MKTQWLSCVTFVAALGVLPLQLAYAADLLCEDKTAALRHQLEHAQAHGNQHRAEGLQRALHAISENCTNERVLAEAEEEVRESHEEVRGRSDELNEALHDGDEDDIQESREKLEEATRELEEHTEELNALQRRLNE